MDTEEPKNNSSMGGPCRSWWISDTVIIPRTQPCQSISWRRFVSEPFFCFRKNNPKARSLARLRGNPPGSCIFGEADDLVSLLVAGLQHCLFQCSDGWSPALARTPVGWVQGPRSESRPRSRSRLAPRRVMGGCMSSSSAVRFFERGPPCIRTRVGA